MSKEVLVTVLRLALTHGVPAVLDAVERCKGEVSVEKIRQLADLVPDPDSYDRPER